MPRFSSIFLPFLVNQSQKHKHKLISSKNKNTNPATNLPCQRNIKATNTNPVRSKQLKTVSSKCSSRALPLVLFFPFQIVEINYFFISYTSLWLSLSHSLATALPISHFLLSLSFSHSLNLHGQTQAVLLLPQTTVHLLWSSPLCITSFISLSSFFFFFFTVRHPRPKPQS